MRLLRFLVMSVGACLGVAVGADSPVVFNEIMYHPTTNEPALEWLELRNQMAVDMDLSGWRLDRAIHFAFPDGTILSGGGYLVVASSPSALAALGVTNAFGPFTGRLNNDGDTLQLRNNNDRLMDEVIYGAEIDWPVAPDGAGPSLARRAEYLASSDPASWRASAQMGGTPGAENFPALPPVVVSHTMVGLADSWKFNDTGADPGLAWAEPDYDDSAWPSGAAAFAFGEGSVPAAPNTRLAPGHITYCFRTRFVCAEDVRLLEFPMRLMADDGAIAYLNGLEILRVNMPDGAVTAHTLALSPVGDAAFGPRVYLAPENLRAGTNLLAVEVHQGPTLAAYPGVVLDSAPVGYWRFGDLNHTALDAARAPGSPQAGPQNGTCAGFSPSNLAQAGPRPIDQISGQPLCGLEADNVAPRFAGNNDSGDDVVTVPDSGLFNFAAARQFTLEAWVNGPPAQESGGAIVAKGTGGGGEQFALDVYNGTYRFFVRDGLNPSLATVAQAGVGPDGTWQHVVAAYDQPAGRMKLYVNGVERASATPTSTLFSSTHEISIGARKNTGSVAYDLNFDGRIDEAAVYHRALTPVEITAHCHAAFATNAAFGPDTNDLAFGLELVSTQTLPPPAEIRLAVNEVASSTNVDFWLELIQLGSAEVDLGGCVLARFGGATNREYVLPSTLLAPGALRHISRAELGFGADSGDRLVLYAPGRARVLDAMVAKKEPRARHPDGTGPWLFPASLTPGASNDFVFRDELVINEIMFHQRDLPAEPAIVTNQTLLTSTNSWRYQADGVDLGADWPWPGYDDSAWTLSNAVFYNTAAPLPAPKNTYLRLTNAAGARIMTFYFRTPFEFTGNTNGLALRLRPLVDDGAVFYLNGAEAARFNLPATNVLYGTLALTNVGTPNFFPEVNLPLTNLVPGLNTLAAEVHQVVPNSGDVAFGAELIASRQLSPPLPRRESPESWVEIYNRGAAPVNLGGWRLDEGIDYRFPSNQIIAPGGYVVVAKDPPYLQSIYSSLDVVGPFTNKLSKNSDLIVLKDPNNNPADQVRYFDSGRWPEDPDGGGSSLELRDPRADNTVAEAWAASDESGKSQWQTYAWRGPAQPAQAGEPTLWHEFALCLLDGPGEALLDDISVIETPGGTARQLIPNGTFSNGSQAHWRFLGTHRHSRVEPDPDTPGHHVLHLVATAAGEYQGNQLETTLTNNTAIVDGREYEISFRARWVSGKSLLNARLYFNRLAQTLHLATPGRSGTPGAVNSCYQTNIGPTFSDLRHAPVIPEPTQPVEVSVEASDPDDVAALMLCYSVNGGAWRNVPMVGEDPLSPGHRYIGRVPGNPAGSIVQFYVEAADTCGAVATYPAGGMNSRALYVVQDSPVASGSSHTLRTILIPADADWLLAGTNALSNDRLACTAVADETESFYEARIRLKGSLVGRNVPYVGFDVYFPPHQLFRGAHRKAAVDRNIGGETLAKQIMNRAGGVLTSCDDLVHFIGPSSGYSGPAQLRLAALDDDYLEAQFKNGSDGPMFEFEVLRYATATATGDPTAPKLTGGPAGPNGYVNYDFADWGDNPESYRWHYLLVNNRMADDFAPARANARLFALSGTNFTAAAPAVLDVDEWLRTLAAQTLIGPSDAHFTGANKHNFRLYARPADGRMLYLPWDWDSAFSISPSAALFGSGVVTKLFNDASNQRRFLNHLYDIIQASFNAAYLGPWATQHSALLGQDLSGFLGYIEARRAYVLGQLPTATAFAITNNAGANFTVTNGLAVLAGTAPIAVNQITVNGVSYPLTWRSATAWTLAVPLNVGANLLMLHGLDARSAVLTNALDSIVVTNTGPSALLPVVINEWMADNRGPGGLPDPADGLFQDWVELFNPNTNAVDLSGLFLTDDLAVPAKWLIPEHTFIGAGGFLLVWADDNTNQNLALGGTNVDLHASFQLSNGGEELGLFAADGVTPLSTVVFGRQLENISQGRFPDGDTNSIFSMTNWTPRAANTLGGLGEVRIMAIDLAVNFVVTITWKATSARTYQVQFTDDLAAPRWTDLGPPIRAAGPIVSQADTRLPMTGSRFYRILLLE